MTIQLPNTPALAHPSGADTRIFPFIVPFHRTLTQAMILLINAVKALDALGTTVPAPTPAYAVADVPDATVYTGAVIFVSDETGGAVLAFSDGTDWRRVTDRAVVS